MSDISPTDQIVLVIEYQVPAHHRAEFIERMAESCRDTIADQGCLRMEFCQPVDGTEGSFVLTELWENQESIDLHGAKPGHAAQHEKVDRLLTDKRVLKLNTFDWR